MNLLQIRGLFLKSRETFGAYFRCHNSLYIFATPGFSAIEPWNILLVFLTLKTCQKITFSE